MRLIVLLLVVFSGVVVYGVNAADETQQVVASDEEQAIVVHLSHFTDDLHRSFMALKTAEMLVSDKVQVTLYLDLEAVRLAERRQDLAVTWGKSSTTLEELYERFTEKGGRVNLCPHCASGARIGSMATRRNARIATEEQLRSMWLECDKVIDF